jgi:hypothetical protein
LALVESASSVVWRRESALGGVEEVGSFSQRLIVVVLVFVAFAT